MARAPDASRYLAKARESLASAETDLDAGRFNSCANRSYYAAFQAAVAVLIVNGIARRGRSWDHKHVISEFSSRLVRRKVVPGSLRRHLHELLEDRMIADYRDADISLATGRARVMSARDLVELAEKLVAK